MRSRKLSPGSCVISTSMRSESTRVPPVTALRSPPDSRITGADSPVTADSSTEAMPTIDRAVAGDQLAGLDHHDVAAGELRRRPLAAVAKARNRVGSHGAQGGRLSLAATLGESLGQVREDDREPQPERHRPREPGSLVAAAERRAPEHLLEPAERGDDGPDLDHEHDRVAPLDARIELREAGHERRDQGAAVEQALALTVHHARLPVQGEIELQHVHAGLAQQAEPRGRRCGPRPAACTRARSRPRTSATRRAWIWASSSEMCGSTPEAEVCTASGGMSPLREAWVIGALALEVGRDVVVEQRLAGPLSWARGC